LSNPIICIPNPTINRPPRTRSQGLEITEVPTNPADAPSETKIIDSPALNASELITTARRPAGPAPFPRFNWSMLTPEISDTYPGTSGKTQGDRKEASPARKAIAIVMFVLANIVTHPDCAGRIVFSHTILIGIAISRLAGGKHTSSLQL
jgi:hypothetical protein